MIESDQRLRGGWPAGAATEEEMVVQVIIEGCMECAVASV